MTFLGVSLYLLITVAGTTDVQLLMDQSLQLPFVSAGIPARYFYVVAPIFLFVFHLNAIFLLSALIDRVRNFRGWKGYRLVSRAYPSLPMSRLIRDGSVFRSVVASVAYWVISAYLPLLVLLAMQARFVAYQSRSILYEHRAIVLFDIILVLVVLRQSRTNRTGRAWAILSMGNSILLIIFCAIIFAVSLCSGIPEIPADCKAEETGWWARWFTPRQFLDVSGANLSIDKEGKETRYRGLLSSRHLRCAVFDGAVMKGFDFRGADLLGASFRGSILSGADFSRIDDSYDSSMDSSTICGAWVRTESLATLRNVIFRGTDLQDARFIGAELEDANLDEVRAQRAVFCHANLKGARLRGDFLSSNFEGADLTGADSRSAKLTMADLGEAVLEMANLQGAELQGALLLTVTRMIGADFRGAKLHLATVPPLSGVLMSGASVRHLRICGGQEFPLHLVDMRDISYKPWSPREIAKRFNDFTPESRQRWMDLVQNGDNPQEARILPISMQCMRAYDSKSMVLHDFGDRTPDKLFRSWPVGITEHDFAVEMGKEIAKAGCRSKSLAFFRKIMKRDGNTWNDMLAAFDRESAQLKAGRSCSD